LDRLVSDDGYDPMMFARAIKTPTNVTASLA